MPGKQGLMAILTLTLWGCGGEVERLEPVPLDKLPAGSIDAAAKALPGVKFDRARKTKFHGQDAYELIGKDKRGKIREAEVSTSGAILEVE